LSDNHPDAEARLIDFGPAIEPVLRASLLEDPSLTTRVTKLLQDMEMTSIEYPAARRRAAAARLLQVINTQEATRVHDKLMSADAPDVADDSSNDWRRRFEAVYRLGPGEDITYIPLPLIPEREMFVKDWHALMSQTNPEMPGVEELSRWVIVAPTSGVVRTNASVIMMPRQTGNPGDKRLQATLQMLARLGEGGAGIAKRVDVSADLQNIELPGDWVIRPKLTQEQILNGLAKVIEKETGRKIAFTATTIQEESIVVKGRFAPAAENAEDAGGVIHIYVDKRADTRFVGDPRQGSLSELLQNLRLTGYRVANEAEATNAQVKWVIHPSAYTRTPGAVRLERPKLHQMLDRLSKETGLTITLEPRPRDVYVGSETK
jgi:hypothetical protein